MLESPVLGQIHPAVIFVFPPLVAQLTNGFAGEGRGWQGRNPKPFVIRGVYLALALVEAIPLQDFLGADHTHGPRIIDAERQSFGIPKLHAIDFCDPEIR